MLKQNARGTTEHHASARTIRSGGRMALAAVALAAAAAATLVPSAAAAPAVATEACTGWRVIQVDNNAAGVKYRECDRYSGLNTQTRAEFYIWDNRHDGKVAQVYTATGSNLNGRWYQSWEKYYAWGNESHHSPLVNTGWHKGHDVKVLLKAVRG
ncbi:hypothetical protein ACIQMY_05385 [Streptomyces sp. NPDC091368]|uniref:hypothetical protein n=1 Tax=Streptomyces sp. NPDC091368 TaxID=3365993 RepID=UPI0038303AA6